jgi:hypothetical protein
VQESTTDSGIVSLSWSPCSSHVALLDALGRIGNWEITVPQAAPAPGKSTSSTIKPSMCLAIGMKVYHF